MSDPADLAAKRAKWRQYFEQRLTGGHAEVQAATDAAMTAARQGHDVEAIIAAGLAAARHYRQHGTPPVPAAAPASVPPSAARAATGSASSGVVTGLQQRQEMLGRIYFTVWNFRLERTDAAGRPLPPIPVEMKGRYFTGAIANGDVVDIGHSFTPGRLVRTRSVRNVTVGTDVKAVGRQWRVLRGLGIAIFLVLFLCVAAVIISVIADVSSFELPDTQLPDPELLE